MKWTQIKLVSLYLRKKVKVEKNKSNKVVGKENRKVIQERVRVEKNASCFCGRYHDEQAERVGFKTEFTGLLRSQAGRVPKRP